MENQAGHRTRILIKLNEFDFRPASGLVSIQYAARPVGGVCKLLLLVAYLETGESCFGKVRVICFSFKEANWQPSLKSAGLRRLVWGLRGGGRGEQQEG